MKNNQPKIIFFDSIASKWDSWENLPVVLQKLTTGFKNMGVASHETILDVGCGTGNLTLALLSVLSDEGRVTAIDISPKMIEKTQKKIQDSRVKLHLSDACSVPEKNETFHRIFCYSVWPHFDNIDDVINEFLRITKPRGIVHVWHLNSKETINQIHKEASEAVRNDILLPATETAAQFKKHGFDILEVIDNDEQYLVSAQKSNRKDSLV